MSVIPFVDQFTVIEPYLKQNSLCSTPFDMFRNGGSVGKRVFKASLLSNKKRLDSGTYMQTGADPIPFKTNLTAVTNRNSEFAN